MKQDLDVVVVGAGVMGAAAAWALSASGRRVLLLERFQIGHQRGSSHGSSRIFRLSYPEPEYARMASEALSLWRALEQDAGEQLVTTTGGFDLGGQIDEHVAALQAVDARYEVFEGNEIATRWDFLKVEGPVLYQPDAGIVAAEKAWSVFAAQAVTNGTILKEGETVQRLEPQRDHVDVVTERAVYSAEAVVVTAGAWARQLLAGAGIELATVPTRETVAYFDLPSEAPIPSFVQWSDPAVYGLATGRPGCIKLGVHHAGPVTDPDLEGTPDPDVVSTLEGWVAEHLPTALPKSLSCETCIYTNTTDERFVLERYGRIVVGSPCSGHGFKFAPLIGRRLQDLVESGL